MIVEDARPGGPSHSSLNCECKTLCGDDLGRELVNKFVPQRMYFGQQVGKRVVSRQLIIDVEKGG